MREVVMQAVSLWKGDQLTIDGRPVTVDAVQTATKNVTGGVMAEEIIVTAGGALYAFAPTELVRVTLPDAPVVLQPGEVGGLDQPVAELEVAPAPAPEVAP